MTVTRRYFAGWRAPLLNLFFGAVLAGVGFVYGEAVMGSAQLLYFVMAAIFCAMAVGGVRWLVLGEEGLAMRAFRFRLASFWINVEMDYAEIGRVEVIGRPFNLFSRARVRLAALKAEDGRMAFLAGRDFAFSDRCLRDLEERVLAVKGKPLRVDTSAAGEQAIKRSQVVMSGALALAVLGFAVLLGTLGEGRRRVLVLADGRIAQAEIINFGKPDSSVTLRLEADRSRRKVMVPGAWLHGRKPGDKVKVKVHPQAAGYFVLDGELSQDSRGYLFALLLVAFGARFFIRSAALPQKVVERLQGGS